MSTQIQAGGDRLLTKKEVAQRFSCSSRSVDRMADSGRLERVKCAGVRFRESDVVAIINGGSYDK
jgi:hypothetical protein